MSKRALVCVVQFQPGPALQSLAEESFKEDGGVGEFSFPLVYKNQPVTEESAPFAPMEQLMEQSVRSVVSHLDVGCVFANLDGSVPDTTVLFPVIQTGPRTYVFPDLKFTAPLKEGEDGADTLEVALDTWIEGQGYDVPVPGQLQGRLGIPLKVGTSAKVQEVWKWRAAVHESANDVPLDLRIEG